MNIAICDDQEIYNDKLKLLLKNYFVSKEINNVDIKEYVSGLDLLEVFAEDMFNFIFLDISMPYIDGKEVASQIRAIDINADIIFVTSMEDQIGMGYEYSAKAFLTKEVTQEKIDKLMDRLLNERSRRVGVGTYPVKLKFDKGIVHLNLSKIMYFESFDKDITAISENENFEFRKQMSALENDLSSKGFIRISRSRLVNILFVFKNFASKIVLITGDEFPISNSYKASVNEACSFKG